MGKLTEVVFNESCCDGGETCKDSAQPCGCDPKAKWTCEQHREIQAKPTFTVKDSGKREQFSGGMVRDVADDKIDYSLIYDGPMLDRWADHLTKGAKKYAARNWMLAEGDAELRRFKASAARHFRQWMRGDTDEDHAAATFFNINGYEYLRNKKSPV